MMAPEETLEDEVITIPEGNMNLCFKFHGNPLNSCCDLSHKTKYSNLVVALEEKSGDHQNH